MNPISRTAYYCCGVRMIDAKSNHPVVGDQYAERFMNEEGMKTFQEFRGFKRPNMSNTARHRIIDDLVRAFIRQNKDPLIVIIGAGFDSRAFRIPGGTWVELDEPQVIERKNEQLPLSECKNSIERIPIIFSQDSLKEKLSSIPSHQSVAVIVEGVMMYLNESSVNNLLNTLSDVFPHHELYCDLMTRSFFEKYGSAIHKKIQDLGASITYTVDDPVKVFVDKGYVLNEKVSTVLKAIDFGLLRMPKFILNWFLPSLLNGYAVYSFIK